MNRPFRFGGLFENMVVMEALKRRYNSGKQQPGLYYFQVQRRHEVDLIINNNRKLTPVEIKAGMTFDPSFAKALQPFLEFAKDSVNPTVRYSGDMTTTIHGMKFDNFKNMNKPPNHNEFISYLKRKGYSAATGYIDNDRPLCLVMSEDG